MKRCGLCDMEKATKERIPACKRPATQQIRTVFMGKATIIDVCDYHGRKARKKDKPMVKVIPISEKAVLMFKYLRSHRRETLRYFNAVQVVRYDCKGCGETVVNDDGSFGKGVGGLDVLAFVAHLEKCVWRRKEMN